jgi:hypothetical protein
MNTVGAERRNKDSLSAHFGMGFHAGRIRAATHQPLDAENCVCGLGGDCVLGELTEQPLVFGERDIGRTARHTVRPLGSGGASHSLRIISTLSLRITAAQLQMRSISNGKE